MFLRLRPWMVTLSTSPIGVAISSRSIRTLAASSGLTRSLTTTASRELSLVRFEPPTLSLNAGQTSTVGLVVDNVNDLFSIPFLLQYNPAVISVEEVRHGGFLQAGDQAIAIVMQVDKEHGQAIISATRQPNTPGASGTGTIMGIVINALGPGASPLSIVQVNARDSQQRPIQLVAGEASVQVNRNFARGPASRHNNSPFCVPGNWQPTTCLAVPHWQVDLGNVFRPAIPIQINKFSKFWDADASAHVVHSSFG